jgi:hypothetical protein
MILRCRRFPPGGERGPAAGIAETLIEGSADRLDMILAIDK